MSHAEVIRKNNDVLQRCTTINLYVIDFLRAKDVLDDEQESDLKAERSHVKQRILLFQWLKVVSSSRYESFLEVMKDAEQEHVANLLTGGTEEDHLPLSDARYTRLLKIRYKMANVTRIDNEVIAELRASKTISMTDVEEIRAETVDYAKVSKLISAIMRRSNYSYNSFQEVLRKTLQTSAAEFLNEGEMTAVHLNNNRPDLDGPLSLAFNGAIMNKTENDAYISGLLAVMNGFSIHPVLAIPGKSIVIFMYCQTVHDAVKLTQLFNSGRLLYILENVLNRLLLTIEPDNTKELDSRIYLDDEDVISLEEFTGIEGWMTESLNKSTFFSKRYSRDATTQTENMKAPSKSVSIRLIQTITVKVAEERNKSIRGLAILGRELFVVSNESPEVEVYDAMKFSFSHRWNLKELIYPQDIGSCNRNKCLYIFDYKGYDCSKEILKLNLKGKLIKSWSTGDDDGESLSVTDESHIILTVANKNKLNEYSPNGRLIREINLPSYAGIRHPWHAIKLTNGHFVVSHGALRDDLHRVCIVDADGKLMKSFGGKRGSAIRKMNYPVHLSVDGNGSVMVLDRWNKRVLLLDSDLKFKREILSREIHCLRAPFRILLNESYGRRLFVTNSTRNEGNILIFQLK